MPHWFVCVNSNNYPFKIRRDYNSLQEFWACELPHMNAVYMSAKGKDADEFIADWFAVHGDRISAARPSPEISFISFDEPDDDDDGGIGILP